MATVRVWTGVEARALRRALRMSVRVFAEYLDVAPRTVSKWEEKGAGTVPRPDTQALLDTALMRATPDQQRLFHLLLADSAIHGTVSGHGSESPRPWEYETWADDLERAVVELSRQQFPAALALLNRWLSRYPATGLDERGLYLRARSLVLLGDARRDQGVLVGPMSAGRIYQQARGIFNELDIPRRVAQIDLAQAVVAEMTGDLQGAAARYQELARDERLSGRDRARARLWIGTALSKDGRYEYATKVMAQASLEFEELEETEDWATGQQKLALAFRGAGEIGKALQYIELARASGTTDTPLQRVRLDTAHAHILLSDRATCDHGLWLLEETAQLAEAAGLSHQVRAIQTIRVAFEQAG